MTVKKFQKPITVIFEGDKCARQCKWVKREAREYYPNGDYYTCTLYRRHLTSSRAGQGCVTLTRCAECIQEAGTE